MCKRFCDVGNPLFKVLQKVTAGVSLLTVLNNGDDFYGKCADRYSPMCCHKLTLTLRVDE